MRHIGSIIGTTIAVIVVINLVDPPTWLCLYVGFTSSLSGWLIGYQFEDAYE